MFVKLNNDVTKQIVRYLCVGAGNNGLVLAIYYTATAADLLRPTIALTVASAVGFLGAYTLQRGWTFKSQARTSSSFSKYSVGYLGSFSVQWLILYIGADILDLPHQWFVLFGLGVATIGFFVLQRYWIFAASEKSSYPPANRK